MSRNFSYDRILNTITIEKRSADVAKKFTSDLSSFYRYDYTLKLPS